MDINAAWQRLKILPLLAVFLIVIQIANTLSGNYLLSFGIHPRDLTSLPFILTAPLIHGGFVHLAGNLFGLGLFSGLCLLRSSAFFFQSSLFIIVVSGLMVWCFGRPASHVGISGLIFGLWSLLIAQANFKNILLAVLIMTFYGGMIAGVFPSQASVSFESHLAGVVAGILCAYVNVSSRYQ